MIRLLPALGLALAACAPAGDTALPAAPGSVEHVLIVVLDGARVEETLGLPTGWGLGWSDAFGGPTAAILPLTRHRLLPEGSLVMPAFQVGPTVTVPAHADLLMAARRPYLNLPFPDGPEQYRPDLPTAFELLRAQEALGPEATVLLGNTSLLAQLDRSIAPGFGEPLAATWDWITDPDDPTVSGESDAVVLRAAREHLAGGARLVLANLHHIDRVGHEDPWRYAGTVAMMDTPLVEAWDWIQSDESGIAESTLMIVTADHGRHRCWLSPTPWQDHGCACSGCRSVPLLLLGPGVHRGALVNTPHVWEDAMATAAWLMGLDLPYATGRVMEDLLVGEAAPAQPTGPRRLSAVGDLLAWEQPTGGWLPRSEVVVGDEVFSDPDALLLEEPRVAEGEGASFACWRQIAVGGPELHWGWQLDCRRLDTGEVLGFPESVVSGHVEPALAVDSADRLWLAFADIYPEEDNGRSIAEDGELRLLRWTPGEGWDMPAATSAHSYGPLHPALLLDGEGALVAWAAGDSIETCRSTRHLEVQRVAWPAGSEPTWSADLILRAEDLGLVAGDRLESPALGRRDGDVALAFLAIAEEGTSLGLAARGEDGWGAATLVDDSATLYPHIPPAFGPDGTLWWARRASGGEVEICRLDPGTAAPICTATGAPWMDSLAPTTAGAWASVSAGGGVWEAVRIGQ